MRILALFWVRMYRIDPIDRFWIFDRFHVCDVHDNCFVVRSNQNALQHIVRIGINLLMGNIRWYKYKIAWSGFSNIFELISPAHPRFASKNKNDAFQCTMVMYASLCIGLDCDRPGPDFLCSNTRMIDCSLTKHTWRLRGVGVKLVTFYHAHPVVFPSIRMFVTMIVAHDLLR